MSRTKDPIKALWKLDHTICMNALNGNLQFDIDKEADYQGEGYDPDDTDCKSIDEAVEYIELLERTVKERESFKRLGLGDLVAKFNRFLDFVDIPTKLHLNEFQDREGLKEYRTLRTELEDYLAILEITSKDPGELGFVIDCKDYKEYVKTFTDIGASIEEVPFIEEEFNTLREYYIKEETNNETNN